MRALFFLLMLLPIAAPAATVRNLLSGSEPQLALHPTEAAPSSHSAPLMSLAAPDLRQGDPHVAFRGTKPDSPVAILARAQIKARTGSVQFTERGAIIMGVLCAFVVMVLILVDQENRRGPPRKPRRYTRLRRVNPSNRR